MVTFWGWIMTEIDTCTTNLEEPSLVEVLDTEHAEDVWDELNALAEAIGRAWQTSLSGVEILSDMRR